MNLYIKIFLICFLTVILPSCGPNKSSGPVDDTPETPQPEPTTPPKPPVDGTPNDTPETPQPEPTTPPKPPVDRTPNDTPETPQPEPTTPPKPPVDGTPNDTPETPQPEPTTPPKPPVDGTPNDTPETPQPEPTAPPKSPEDEIVEGAPEDKSTITKANLKTLDSLTAGDLEKNNLLGEGGSSLYSFYMNFALSHAKEFLNSTNVLKAELPPLCFDEESCSKDLIDVTRLDRSHMAHLIKKIGLSKPVNGIIESAKAETPFTFAFLQGHLSSDNDAINIATIKDFIDLMDQNNTRKILINLVNFWKSMEIYFLLGEYIHKKQVELHIVGQCTDLCASYLILAAKTVIIEPYGYISYGGSYTGFYNDLLEAVPRQEADISNFINNPNVDDLYKFFVDGITEAKQFSDNGQAAITKNFIDNLRNWDRDSTNEGAKIAASLEEFLSDKGSVLISHLTNKDIKEFCQKLSDAGLMKTIKSFFAQKDPYNENGNRVISSFYATVSNGRGLL